MNVPLTQFLAPLLQAIAEKHLTTVSRMGSHFPAPQQAGQRVA